MRLGFVLIFAVLFSGFIGTGNASAVNISGLENSISVGETPAIFSFIIENTGPVKKELSVEFKFPAKVQIVRAPEFVQANEKAEISFKVFPEEKLEGDFYTGIVSINLGGSRLEKSVSIYFGEEDNCTVQISPELNEQGVLSISAKNDSFKAKKLEILALKNVPSDWQISGEKEFRIGAFEQKTFETQISRNSNFEGEMEIKFLCAGEQVSAKTSAKFESAGTFAGMAVFLQEVLSANANGKGMADAEFIADAFLAIIAAILMIAFIARLVKVFYRREQTKLNGK